MKSVFLCSSTSFFSAKIIFTILPDFINDSTTIGSSDFSQSNLRNILTILIHFSLLRSSYNI